VGVSCVRGSVTPTPPTRPPRRASARTLARPLPSAAFGPSAEVFEVRKRGRDVGGSTAHRIDSRAAVRPFCNPGARSPWYTATGTSFRRPPTWKNAASRGRSACDGTAQPLVDHRLPHRCQGLRTERGSRIGPYSSWTGRRLWRSRGPARPALVRKAVVAVRRCWKNAAALIHHPSGRRGSVPAVRRRRPLASTRMSRFEGTSLGVPTPRYGS